ncbi:cytochrome c [Ectobacillus sp. JY-23]|uniref:cytochrome c551 n=1 Tax=Ectobacillus sp. JY-23 TaxID=2933872 RepID=UPI001FF357D1|nr:cytochrome c [Ectobacillus sp. JY-23]UOY91077.1 cytochrome c [Ectobacillus sp. JY-23]
MKKTWLIASAVLVLGLSACGVKEESKPSETAQTSDGSEGEKIYQQSCSSCHGNNLQGQVGPGLKHVGGKYDQAEIEKIILKGRGSMPAGVIKGEDATKVAEWLAGKK